MHVAGLVFPGEYKKKQVATRSRPVKFPGGCMHFAAYKRLDARKQIPVLHSTSEQRGAGSAAPPSEIDK